MRFEEPLKSSEFTLLDWVKLADSCIYFYYRDHRHLGYNFGPQANAQIIHITEMIGNLTLFSTD